MASVYHLQFISEKPPVRASTSNEALYWMELGGVLVLYLSQSVNNYHYIYLEEGLQPNHHHLRPW